MANGITGKIAQEYETNRRRAERDAQIRKADIYTQIPVLSDIDREITSVATDYTKRMINGEDVKSEMQSALKELSDKKKHILNENGLDMSVFEPRYNCSVCNDTGYVGNEMCACFKNRIIEENFRFSNIGETLSHQTFDSFDFEFYSEEKQEGFPLSPRENMRRNFAVCNTFANRFDEVTKNLLLTGKTGLGKTFLSTCIANKLLSTGKSVVYISAVDFFKRIEKSRFDSTNTDTLLFENCDLLIIDDLGTEAPSVYTTAVFSDILDKRIRTNRKMIFSSNHRFSEFEKIYGERVSSRLAGHFECLIFYGKDIRIQKFINGDRK